MPRKYSRKNSSFAHGFTLIEILCVVTVVALIAVLIVPAVNSALDKSRAGVCLHNLQGMGNLLHLYLADHDGNFPPDMSAYPADANSYHPFTLLAYYLPAGTLKSTSWNPACDKNLKGRDASIFWCPSDVYRQTGYQDPTYGFSYFGAMSYNVNQYVGWGPKYGLPWPSKYQAVNPTRLRQILYAVDRYYNKETFPGNQGSPNAVVANSWPANLSGRQDGGAIGFKHSNLANGLFLDGHCGQISYTDMAGTGGKYFDTRN